MLKIFLLKTMRLGLGMHTLYGIMFHEIKNDDTRIDQ